MKVWKVGDRCLVCINNRQVIGHINEVIQYTNRHVLRVKFDNHVKMDYAIYDYLYFTTQNVMDIPRGLRS